MTPSRPEEEPPPSYAAAKPFLDHLEDLRWTLLKCIVAFVTASVACFIFRKEILNVLTAPLFAEVSRDSGFLSALGVADSFMISIKVAAFAGLVVALPFILFFLGQFLIPALTSMEKRMVFPVFISGVCLFVSGVLVCYLFLLPLTIRFFIADSAYMGIRPVWTIQNYISFVTQFAIGMGLSFEMPVAILALAKLGIITHEFLRQKRRYFIVAIFFLSACLTPTSDIFTMTVVAAPLVILYEICVWVTWSIEKGRRKTA
jgi:sec-independent protein translocase protein TatC